MICVRTITKYNQKVSQGGGVTVSNLPIPTQVQLWGLAAVKSWNSLSSTVGEDSVSHAFVIPCQSI